MGTTLRLGSSENQWVLDGAFYSLGRSRTANLKINRASASRIHIFFFNDPERGFLVCDAGSSNGALLNGQLILKPELLVDADVIEVASEPLHVSFAGADAARNSERATVESAAILNARFYDKGTEWGVNSKMQSRAIGEWFYRTMKLIMSHGGHVVQVTDRTITGLWDKVDQSDQQQIQSIVECSRQMNQFGLSLNELLADEWGLGSGSSLFKSHIAVHYGPIKRKEFTNGQFKVEGDDLMLVSDLSAKAADLDCEIVSTERFPSRVEDRSTTNPMLMVEVGARRQAMVLYPLRAD
jgi:hypothetical protein